MKLATQKLEDLLRELKKINHDAHPFGQVAVALLDRFLVEMPILTAYESLQLLQSWHAAGNGSFDAFKLWYESTYNIELQIKPKQQS